MATPISVDLAGLPTASWPRRIVGAFVSPKATFADIAARPGWVAPFVLLMILQAVVGGLLGQRANWRDHFEQKANASSRFDNRSPEQREALIDRQIECARRFSFVLWPLGAAALLLFLALLYWGVFFVGSEGKLGFKTALSITTYAHCPIALLCLLSILVLMLKPSADIDPERLLASNIAALLTNEAPRWLQTVGRSLEVFWIWTLLLISIGFSVVRRRQNAVPAYAFVFGLWALWILFRIALSAI